LLARLDIKGPNLIKGIHLEGLRVIGSPNEYAKKYYQQGADELLFIDTVASLYGRNHLGDIIQAAAKNIFIPITVGGGLRSIDDARDVLRSGADKVAINTAAVSNPGLITEISRCFGSQCMVLSVQAKFNDCNYKSFKKDLGKWEVFTDNGRESTGIDAIEWIKKGITLGAGEILVTSIDKEGTREGFDVDLMQAITNEVTVPVICSGGMGKAEDLITVVKEANVDAVAMADILHYERDTIDNIRALAKSSGIQVRNYEPE
jgi:cyclase